MYNSNVTKYWLDLGDLDLIFKVKAVEKLKIHDGGHLFSLKTLLLVYILHYIILQTSAVEFAVS